MNGLNFSMLPMDHSTVSLFFWIWYPPKSKLFIFVFCQNLMICVIIIGKPLFLYRSTIFSSPLIIAHVRIMIKIMT